MDDASSGSTAVDRGGSTDHVETPTLAVRKEQWIAAEIRQRVLEHNLNAIIIFIGPTGFGKSYSGLRLAELIDPKFGLSHIAFSAENFLDLVNGGDIEPGQVIVW